MILPGTYVDPLGNVGNQNAQKVCGKSWAKYEKCVANGGLEERCQPILS